MRISRTTLLVSLLAPTALGLSLLGPAPMSRAARPLERINHVIVIYQENWSFGGLSGRFPGANGIATARAAVRQVDKSGRPSAALPRPTEP